MYDTGNFEKKKKAVLVGVSLPHDENFEYSFQELDGLSQAAGIEVVAEVVQNLNSPDSAAYIGSGKIQELKGLVFELDADLVIVNNQLSPSQLANLSHDLEVEVIDRTNLILNIFADRARTREARMQVDYAKLQYMLPRLVGLRQNLSRQGGTGGSMSNKGSGETQIELDRRHIEKQMAELRHALKDIARNRVTQRSRRQTASIPLVSLVGYTNAGKSTLMNALLGTETPHAEKHVYAENMLFATLDTTVRRIEKDGHHPFLLSDTVGFINDLPHDLVNAFRSTLEEALHADLILEVIDCSDEHYQLHMDVTARTLKELGAGAVPVIYVFNKSDLCYDEAELPIVHSPKIYISAAQGIGLDELLCMIEDELFSGYITMELRIPFSESRLENELRNRTRIYNVRYEDDGIYVRADLDQELLQRYRSYLL